MSTKTETETWVGGDGTTAVTTHHGHTTVTRWEHPPATSAGRTRFVVDTHPIASDKTDVEVTAHALGTAHPFIAVDIEVPAHSGEDITIVRLFLSEAQAIALGARLTKAGTEAVVAAVRA